VQSPLISYLPQPR